MLIGGECFMMNPGFSDCSAKLAPSASVADRLLTFPCSSLGIPPRRLDHH